MKISNYITTPFRSLALGILVAGIIAALFITATGLQICIEKTVHDGLQTTISDLSHIESKKIESKK